MEDVILNKLWVAPSLSRYSYYSTSTRTSADNFDKYYLLNSKCYGKIKQPSPEFLNWLIGFTEGDGSFVKAKRSDLYFVIVQDTRDKQVLDFIKKELNMGEVIVQGKTTSRFIIQDKLPRGTLRDPRGPLGKVYI